jgi:hypothetical protein
MGGGSFQRVIENQRTWLACALLAAVSFLAYAPVLQGYFLADDFAYARLYANRPFIEWVQIVPADWTRGVWGYQFDELRSMLALSFWWDGKLWAFHPLGYHFTNLLFHAATTVMVFFLARTVFAGAFSTSLVAGLLFSLHPVHSEAVSWISGRADPMCAFFSLVSLWTYMLYRERGRPGTYAISLAAFVLALFSKEIAITFPLLPLGWDLVRKRRLTLALAGYFALLAGYMLTRRAAFPHAIRQNVLTAAAVKEFAHRQLEYLHFLIPVIPVAVALLLCVAAGFVLRRRCPLLFFGPWWYAACVAPLIVTYSSPRHLYLASVGICLLIACAIPRRGFKITAACLLLASGGLGLRENLAWAAAGHSSEGTRRGIEEFARTLPDGSGLILDIPEALHGRYFWLSSLPFALEPPYSIGTVYPRVRAIERPTAYQYWSGSPEGTGRTWIEDRRPVLQDLIARPAECYRVTVDEAGKMATSRVDEADLAGLRELVAKHKTYDSVFEINGEWIAFWKSRPAR